MNIKKLYQDNHHVFQKSSYACGPVTLLNILRQKGDDSHTEEELMKRCKTKASDGTSNENIVSTAEAVGLQIVEEKADASAADIERHIDENNAVIVNYFYAFSSEGHFAQVADYDDHAFYLIDPSAGYMRIKKEYFASNWHSDKGDLVGWFVAVR